MSMDNHSLYFDGDFLILLLDFIAAAALTRVVRALTAKYKILDQPDRVQCSHTAATPRGGGLGFALVFLSSLWGLAIYHQVAGPLYRGILLGGLLIAGISFKDDYGSVSVPVRFLVHLLAAGWLLWEIGGTPLTRLLATNPAWLQTGLGHWVSLLLGNFIGAIVLVWFINLINFIDGLDGLAGSQAIFMAGSGALFFYLQAEPGSSFLCLLLVLAVLGFLVWNWPPALIFMGDVGSCFLGFVLGAFALSGIHAATVPLPIWLILSGVALADTTVTLLRRVMRRERWWESHRKFAFQHTARYLESHLKVTVCALLIDLLWLGPLAWAAWRWPAHQLLLTVLALLPLAVAALYLGAGVEYSLSKRWCRAKTLPANTLPANTLPLEMPVNAAQMTGRSGEEVAGEVTLLLQEQHKQRANG